MMQVVEFQFAEPRAKKPAMTWKPDPVAMDDADEPAWAVWETECRRHRVDYDAATDSYTLRTVREGRNRGGLATREWVAVLTAGTLEQAMGGI